MSYFKVLGLDKEPFSTSPDPEFFYLSREHENALTNLLIELRLKRGLSVILGDVGTGKTTLSRKLIQELRSRDDFVFHIILDPSFDNEYLFIKSLVSNFELGISQSGQDSILDLRQALERFLFRKGVGENKTVTLIIDEAQKLNAGTLEILRVLLNYETNEFKLLQLVLLGQLEFYSRIVSISNFFDRISFKYTLNPLGVDETRELIEFRVRQAGCPAGVRLFLDEAISEIHSSSKGYPRRINMLCHATLKSLVMQSKDAVDADMVRTIVNAERTLGWHRDVDIFQHKGLSVV
jgi:general secretion pathway protein A